MSEKPLRSRITGCWKKSGVNGDFYTGSFKKDVLLAALKEHGDIIQVFVNRIESKTNETDPDLSITMTDKIPYVAK